MSYYFEVLILQNSQIIFIDQQLQMVFGVQFIDCQMLKNNVVGLVKVVKVFDILVIIIMVEIDSFFGLIYLELLVVFFEQKIFECISMNFWDDQNVCDLLVVVGCKKVVVVGLWIEVCNIIFVFCVMFEGGYEIYMVVDVLGGIFSDVYKYVMDCMVQVGVVLVIWQQVLLEWQCDWVCWDIYDVVMVIVKEYFGVYGMGVDYVYIMVYKVFEWVIYGECIGLNLVK